MVHNTTTLGGSASTVVVGKVAHGLMTMTARFPAPVPDEEAFAAIKAGIDALPTGAKMFLNSGEFYANDFGPGNLELLSRFFEKYPEYADRTFLSVKGGTLERKLAFDSSPENLRRSVLASKAALRGKKKIDLFQSCRVDRKYPIEEVMQTLKGLLAEGHFDHIGISECSAATLKRAAAVAPIAAVEIEVSPWSYEEETKKVLETANELGIAVAAYSPLGHGFLTGSIKSPDDIPEGDMRRHFTRFKEEYFKANYAIVDALKAIAERKKVTPGQLCIAWVGSLGKKVIPLPGSSNAKRTLENLAGGDIELSDEEQKEIFSIIEKFEVKGDRYTGADPQVLHLWG
ncbi:aldo/keto reductase [Panus rudis PR-1116 ss-1]|nr:aldo/keto reductase [Panus rudis PR-1116 ss-1]